MTATGLEPRTTKFVNEHSTIWPKWPNDWALFWVLICTMHLTVCFCHVTCAFQSEFTLYSCLNVEELLAWSWREIWSLSDCNWPHSEDSLWNAYVTWQEHTLYWQYLQKSWRLVGWYWMRGPGFDWQPGSILCTVEYLQLMVYF